MPLMRMSNSPSSRLASLSMKPKHTTMARDVMPLAPLKKCSKNCFTVMIFCGTYSRNWAMMASTMPCTRSLPNRMVPPTSTASGTIAFHAGETRLSSTSAMSTSFSAFSSLSKAGPPACTR